MSRPRIENFDEKIIDSFIERGFYKTKSELISAALWALVREQRQKDAERQNLESTSDDSVYNSQFDPVL